MPLDLWETSFRMEMLQQINKTRSADKFKNMSNEFVNISPTTMPIGPWSSTNTMLKNMPTKVSLQEIMSKSAPTSEVVSEGGGPWGTVGDPNRFGTLKMGPSSLKVLPMIEK